MTKTFITKMPDKPGAFLLASRIFSAQGVNISRVSYNKAVDVNTLFIDVTGSEVAIARVSAALEKLGYLCEQNVNTNVILLNFILRDVPGAVTPVLEIISNYDFNISYISAQGNSSGYQNFKMGLLVENPNRISRFLEEVSKICEVRVIDYDKSEKTLDNTVFYLSFASGIASKIGLSREETNEIIAYSNAIMQLLDERNESPFKTFEYIGKYADLLAKNRGDAFNPRITSFELKDARMHCIEPPCGSNSYIVIKNDHILCVDCGFAIYRDEMLKVYRSLVPGFDTMRKDIILTHTDLDHCGLLDLFDRTYLCRTGYTNFRLASEGKPTYREHNPFHAVHYGISLILSRFQNPSLEKLYIINENDRDPEQPLSYIGRFEFEGMTFTAYEGNGGHVPGETVLLCDEQDIVFTGDVLINTNGYTKEQADFNLLAPYLMTSVNLDSEKATSARKALLKLLSSKEILICGGHGIPWKNGNK